MPKDAGVLTWFSVSLWEERAARNEALFREVNEQAQRLGDQWRPAGEPTQFVCECADTACLERIAVPTEIYEQVRANPRRFLVRPGHQHPELETLVTANDDYLVVEKTGASGRVAEQTDPRSE